MAVNMITIDYQINGRMVILTLSFWSGERFCRLRGGQTIVRRSYVKPPHRPKLEVPRPSTPAPQQRRLWIR